jgi:hypothetical protein
MGSPLRLFCKFFLSALLLMVPAAAPRPARAQQASDLITRQAPDKPARTQLRPEHDAARVIVKFREGTRVRRGPGGGLAGTASFDPLALNAVLTRYGLGQSALRRLVQLPETRLDALRTDGERRSGRALADMNLYFRLEVPSGTDVAALCDELNALPFVELAEPAVRPMPPPVDLPPPTPDFSSQQSYDQSPPSGIGALDPAVVLGADGSGITLVDIEYSWRLDHEDLEIPPSAVISAGTPTDPFNNNDHGTAVLGEIGARKNGYGMTGGAPGTTLRVAPVTTVEFGYDVALTITQAMNVLGAGDVILLEQQMCVCGNTCNAQCTGCGPVEWQQATYDAIALATAQGISVVEAAGNGGVQLDSPSCLGRFNRSIRDSGAIIVGAGDAFHQRLSFSAHGSRLDLQGWGTLVATTGYGDLFNPEARQRYTSGFNGTSSASPIVASAVAAVQGAASAGGGSPLDPISLRMLLTATGAPQDACDPVAQKVGPFPNLPAALGRTSCNDGLENDGDGLIDGADPDCDGGSEKPVQCHDGWDNDGDGRADLADGDCINSADPSEWSLRAGDVLLADVGLFEDLPGGYSQALRVDPVTGFQTELTHPREVTDAVALRLLPDGRVLGLDFASARVFEINPAAQSVSYLGGCAQRAWGFAPEAAGTLVFTDSAAASVLRFNPISGAQISLSSAGLLHVPRGIEVEADGSLLVVDQGLGPFLPSLLRIHPVSGAQTGLSSGDLLNQPRGVALEATGSAVVASSGSLVRIDTQSGAQSLVASGGNLAALGGVAVDDCTGEIFAAERGVSSAPAALVRVNPVSGAQRVITSGGLLVEPIGVSFVPGSCAPLPLVGAAMGGSVGVQIGEVVVRVQTVAGQSLAAILKALATAIRNHPALESEGASATVSGLVLYLRGGGHYEAFSDDPGLRLGRQGPASVPALPPAGLGALAALLAGAGALVQRRRRQRFDS